MRRLLLFLLLFCLSAGLVRADDYPLCMIGFGGGGGGASCTTLADSQTTQAASSTYIFRYASNRDRYGGKFTAGSTYSVCSVTVRLGTRAGGTPSPNTMHAEIWTDNGGSPSLPSAKTGGSSDAVAFTSVSTSTLADSDTFNITFTWSAAYPALTSGTAYWIVLVPDWTTTNNEHCSVGTRTGESNMNASYDRDTSAWTAVNFSRMYYKINK